MFGFFVLLVGWFFLEIVRINQNQKDWFQQGQKLLQDSIPKGISVPLPLVKSQRGKKLKKMLT